MRNFTLVLMCWISLTLSLGDAARTCSDFQVPPCPQRADRDILFLLDTSESMNPARFYSETLDFTQAIYCAFDQRDTNRAGIVTFSATIREAVPFQAYSILDWFAAVEVLRATPDVCCSCCTPTANAFNLAVRILKRDLTPLSYRIVFTVTDGAPWNNVDNALYGFPGTSPAEYVFQKVPLEAQNIRLLTPGDQSRSRVMLIGVPNKDDEAPRSDYFAGIPDISKTPSGKPTSFQCLVRNGQRSCEYMNTPPFPIVSKPVNKNLFSTNTWNVQSLIDQTVPVICELLPTPQPSRSPTKKPTTSRPSKSPTRTPTRKPTIKPSGIPTRQPSRTPATSIPSKTPTRSPIKPELQGLDMFFLIDRSRSMRWVPDLCRKAPGGNLTATDDVACWQLFLNFVKSIVTKTSMLPFRVTQQIGWQSQFADKRRGLRVSLYAFACANNQRTPITLILGEKIDNPIAFQQAISNASSMVPWGGTCPGEAIERAVAYAQGVNGVYGDQYYDRPMKTAILFTDGVWYDGDRPQRAAQGLFYFNVLTYAMAIAVPYNGSDNGLTGAEIQTQKQQLTMFARNDSSRFINLGMEGIMSLDRVANSFVKKLPGDVIKNFYVVSEKPYWCGYTNSIRCTTLDPAKVNTGKYCKWLPKQEVCVDKIWCNYLSRLDCLKDNFCYWSDKKCHTGDRVMASWPPP